MSRLKHVIVVKKESPGKSILKWSRALAAAAILGFALGFSTNLLIGPIVSAVIPPPTSIIAKTPFVIAETPVVTSEGVSFVSNFVDAGPVLSSKTNTVESQKGASSE